MITFLFAALGVGLVAQNPVAPAPVDPAIIRVYVHTADMGHPDELAARRDSLTHLAHAIAG